MNPRSTPCPCYACVACVNKPELGLANPALGRMIVCPLCGNKRCPHAQHHGSRCTRSNDLNQVAVPIATDADGALDGALEDTDPVTPARLPADGLGDRMKAYERAGRTTFPRRMPVILRVDGKAFHTYTRGCVRPFDKGIGDGMVAVALALFEEIQGAQLAFVQSDEVSVLIHGYKRYASHSWFDNQAMKIVSVAASIAASTFTAFSPEVFGAMKLANFDARAFVIPESDVCNYFLWRQQDATRNSIQMLARSLYSHRDCYRKNTSELQEMCFAKGHNWNDLATRWKRGVCVQRSAPAEVDGRTHPTADYEVPIFSQDRSYIERHLALEPEDAPGDAAAAARSGEPPRRSISGTCAKCGAHMEMDSDCPRCYP